MRIRDQSKAAIDGVRGSAAGASGSSGGPTRWLLAIASGIGIGAIATYLLDPERGRTRRARLADQAAAGARRMTHRAGQIGRLQAGRIAGLTEELRHRGDAAPALNDASLANKVETTLFRDASVPKGAININVEQGIVVLRGEVDNEALKQRLEDLARGVSGVDDVRNQLHLPAEPATTQR